MQKAELSLALVFHRGAESSYSGIWANRGSANRRPATAKTVESRGDNAWCAKHQVRQAEIEKKCPTESATRSQAPLLAESPQLRPHGLPVRFATGARPERSVRIRGCTYFRC